MIMSLVGRVGQVGQVGRMHPAGRRVPTYLAYPTYLTHATYPAIALSIRSSSAIVGRQLAALDSGSRPSRIALVNSTSCRSNAVVPSSDTSLTSLSVIESRYTL